MKRNIFLTAILLVMTFPVTAQSLAQLEWMRGTWTQNKGGDIVQESWLGPRGGMMAGVNLSSSAKGTSFEFLRVLKKTER